MCVGEEEPPSSCTISTPTPRAPPNRECDCNVRREGGEEAVAAAAAAAAADDDTTPTNATGDSKDRGRKELDGKSEAPTLSSSMAHDDFAFLVSTLPSLFHQTRRNAVAPAAEPIGRSFDSSLLSSSMASSQRNLLWTATLACSALVFTPSIGSVIC